MIHKLYRQKLLLTYTNYFEMQKILKFKKNVIQNFDVFSFATKKTTFKFYQVHDDTGLQKKVETIYSKASTKR